MLKSVWKFKQNMAKSHKTCMEQAEIIDTFGTYHPTMICLPLIAFLSSFGRETSLINIMGPRSIFPPLFTPSIYFLLLLSVAAIIIFLPCVLILCKQQGRRD